jgi:hypothetical protein
MLPFVNKKYFISIGIIVVVTILVTILYTSSSSNTYSINFQNFQFNRVDNHSELSSVRIFCLILTTPKNYLTRAKAINETWARRCDRYFFITESSQESMTPEQINFTQQIPIAPIKDILAGYDHLTLKSTLAFLFAYENYLNDFDWFIKADDDTYLIIENLKAFLSEQNSSEPVTFGYNFKVINNDHCHPLYN